MWPLILAPRNWKRTLSVFLLPAQCITHKEPYLRRGGSGRLLLPIHRTRRDLFQQPSPKWSQDWCAILTKGKKGEGGKGEKQVKKQWRNRGGNSEKTGKHGKKQEGKKGENKRGKQEDKTKMEKHRKHEKRKKTKEEKQSTQKEKTKGQTSVKNEKF